MNGTAGWRLTSAIPATTPRSSSNARGRPGTPNTAVVQYVPGDFNCLHQDLYGDLAFPILVAILLSEPGGDFTGGEFVLTEQRPRIKAVLKSYRFGKAMP